MKMEVRVITQAQTAILLLMSVLFMAANCDEQQVKLSLINFMDKLSGGNAQKWGWTNSSDPCIDKWSGVTCNSRLDSVKHIVLDGLNLTGVFDAGLVCSATSLAKLSLNRNYISGQIPEDIGSCGHQLTHLYLSGNQFSGGLPESLSRLVNLKALDISHNGFSGKLPDLQHVSGLVYFLAQNNKLTGEVPTFDFTNLKRFNVSNNNFYGPVPDLKGKFTAESFLGNSGLCGEPLDNACPQAPSQAPSHAHAPHAPQAPPLPERKRRPFAKNFFIYSGYMGLILVILVLLAMKFLHAQKVKQQTKHDIEASLKGAEVNCRTKQSSTSSSFKTNKSEASHTSNSSGMVSSSLIGLTSPAGKELRFEDLLQAPADLLKRGKHGSLYKVVLGNGVNLAVKRIKGWNITNDDFKNRMLRIDIVRHPNVLPAVAFYCSRQEKLLVYEYQRNGSLFSLLQGSQNGQAFHWGSRLNVAASVAQTLAHMHKELQGDGIAHGNFKSTNILFNQNMDPCVTEYGLMPVENQDQTILSPPDGFKADIFGFGVILLELLTGELVHNNGMDLARWVHSVVSEEWTIEVFDKTLVQEGASEERMVGLLQVAFKCTSPVLNERATISQVASMINRIKEEEERSGSWEA